MPITHARVAAEGITLTSGLHYQVPIEYVDQANPQVVLYSHTIVLPLDATTDTLITRAKEYGRTIRAAQAALAAARAAVSAGSAVPID